ncbi:MAG: DEAD/DEAH box helicase [Spirochaetaceae bacterium]|nr:DEAD/DEAH box helicase [Spirochaetaceae bacterium]
MSDYSFPAQWQEILAKKQIINPTAVQQKVIPLLAEKKNILFQSETGTGKTLAYLIPLIDALDTSTQPKAQSVQLVIAAPTHELASQIKAEVQSVTDVKTVLLIGGAPLKRQQELLKEKPVIVIGTPARLTELIMLKKLKTTDVKAFVLDEADRLLSQELREHTLKLAQCLGASVQIVACSATIKPFIEKLINQALPELPQLETVVLPPEDILQRKISHWAIFAEQRDKIDTVRKFLAATNPAKALVFTSRPDQVMNIYEKLKFKKVDCEALHAKAGKQERKAAIDRFRSGKCTVLITSDLASRGLDFPGITHIIQTDIPSDDDFFIHRAGRTARAGAEGINVIIGDEREMRILAKMEKKLKIKVYPKELYGGQVVSPEAPETPTEDKQD